MAKNKKKKNTRQDLEQQFGNGIAPISTKKTSAKNKKNTKKSTKKVDTMEETKKNKNVDTKPIAPVEIKKDDKFTIKTPEIQRTQEQEEAYNKKKSQATLNGQYIGKKAVSGVTTGLTGLVDAPLQTFQEGVEQGKGSSAAKNIIKGYVKSIDYLGLTNIPENAKELSEIATNDKLKTGQKIVKSGLAILNNNPVVQMIEGSGRLFKGLDKNAEKHVEKAREVVEKPSEKVSEWAEKDADKVDKWAKTVGGGAEVTTNMIPSIAASIITQNPNVGLAVMGVSAKGTSTREAEKKGATLSEANDIGFAKGAIEVLTEKMFSGFGKVFGKGALDDVAKEGLNRIIKNKGANYVAKRGMDILGEWFEETVSDLVDTYIDKNTTDPDATYTFKDWLETGKMTALSTIMLNGITGGYMPSTVIENNTELEKSSQSKNVQKIIEKELEERLNAEYNGKATAREIAQLQKEVIEDIQKGYISTDTIEKTLGGDTYNKLESINQERNKIQEQINELEQKAKNNELSSLEEKQKLNDLKEQIKTIDDTEIKNQLNKEIQETIKNDIGLQESYNEVGRRTENYKVDLDSIQDEKQRAVYQKAMDSGVLNNSNKTHALVDMIAKISSEKGINFDFTNNEQLEKSGFGVNGRNINGYVTDSGITINLNSSKAINRIVGHELTHTFEGTKFYTELQDSLKDFLGNEWAKQVAKYEELYKGVKNANIENELTSDLIGDYLFTDESFVRSLSTEHRNLFEKIYDEIKYLYRVATAGSKERRMLEKVKRTFDRIYNETSSEVESEEKNVKKSNNIEKIDESVYNDMKIGDIKNISTDEVLKLKKSDGGYRTEQQQSDLKAKIIRENGVKDPIEVSYTNGEYIVENGNHRLQYAKELGFDEVPVKLVQSWDDIIPSKEGALNEQTTKGISKKNGVSRGNERMLPESNTISGNKGTTNENARISKTKSNSIKQTSSNENSGNNKEVGNTSFSLSKDSQGRELSEGQQEYFKDETPELLDENGNLKQVYHGTNYDFTVFKNPERQFNEYASGKMFANTSISMFTDSQEVAQTYIDNQEFPNRKPMGVYLKMTHPYVVDANYQTNKYFIDNDGTPTNVNTLVKKIYDSGKYDGIVIKNIADLGNYEDYDVTDGRQYATDYIVFESNQVKDINNEHPTSNDDIRYSLSVSEANTTEDNEGRKLSKDQLDYFKDTKAVDNDGNLITVYHTTTEPIIQFNEFDPRGTEGYKFGDQVVNFYTNSKTMSGSYADYVFEMANTKKLNNIQEAIDFVENITGEKIKLQKGKSVLKGKEYYSLVNEYGDEYAYALSEEDLLRNVSSQLQRNYGNPANIQYEGYVNITNPYIIDAKEANWDEILTGYDELSVRYANEINQEDREKLIELAQISKEKVDEVYNRLEELYKESSDIVMLKARPEYIKEMKAEAKKKGISLDKQIEQRKQEIDKELEEIKSKQHFGDDYFRENVGELQDKINNELNTSYSDFDLYQMAINNFDEEQLKHIFGTKSTTNGIVKDVLEENKYGANYDGVIIKNVIDYGSTTEFDDMGAAQDVYVTFNSNQFKAADNTSPTDDADIRYSISKTDSEGRELSEGQQEYFRDSKVRDENGNLKVMYHGSQNKFSVFSKTFGGWYGDGYYFTDSKESGIDYAKGLRDESGALYETYLDITNPYEIKGDTVNKDGSVNFAPGFREQFTNDFKKQLPDNWDKIGSTEQDHLIKVILQKNGYDGIHNGDVWVAYEPNQIKNIDNLNPTENDDIRYSLDIAPISKNFLTESEQKELDGLRALDNSGWTELTPEESSRMYELENRANTVLDKKAEKMLRSASYKAINTTTKIAENYLDFDAKQKKDFRNQMREFSNMTKDELVNADTYNKVKDIVSQYANREYTYFDDSVESVKKELRHTKIKISDELKNQITDYGDFVRDSRLLLRRNSGTPVDQVYQEYSDMYPGFFSNEVINEADQLEELNNFINHDFSVTEKYKLSDEDLRVATDLIYNKLLDNSLSQQDLIETEEMLDKKVQKRTRAVVREELLNKMGITPELIGEGNDISAIDFARTDPIRVNEKVFGWKTGQLINDATVNFTKHQEAERIRFLNQERQEIKDLGIKARSKESELVQKYGEKQYVDKNNEVHPYTDAELNRDVKDAATREKIKNAARVLRQKYDTYIDKVNSVLTEMGYDEIPKRQDYMRHFVELNDKFSRWGLPFNKETMMSEDLPTDINGLTEFNRPGKSYFASANTRTGLQTTYDAITGIDGYLEGVSNLIYHTESIQRYRALTRFIRENYGREHGLDNIDLMTDEELADRIKDIQDNKLSKYVAWLDEQANSIAGKKGSLDRSIERMFGRRIYTALNTLKSQVGSNMTGFNVRSAMTNFASAIQGAAKTKKLALVKGTISTINNIIHNDGLIDKSDFLTRRFGSDSLAMKPWQKLSKAGQIFMEGTDYFTANQIWRSKYFENLDKGMSETQAIKNADDFAARIMGDRSKGSTAELFNSKTLGFLSQFQLEVNNQWSSLVHDNKIDIQKGNKTALGVTFELGQLFAASYMFNTMMKALTGSDVMIDPIDMLLKIFKPKDDDKDEGIVKRAQKVLGEFINQLPFANLVTGGGRIPISEAFTGAKTLGKKLMGGTDNYGNEISWGDVGDDLKESLAYWILPTGYGQIRKTVKGLSMYDDKLPIAGSYTDSGNLRFSAEDTPFGKIKAGLFGQYSSKYAQDYIDSGYKSINASKLDEMKDLDMNSTEYRDYREGLSAAGTSIEDKLNYISDLDVSDEDKTIMASNVAKKDIDMAEYKKFGSYDEFNYAQKNPAKYEVMKLVGGYDTYKNYEKAISEITADYDRNGKAITNSRKNKVIKYVNSLNLTRAQKAMLIKEQYPSFTQYDSQIASYVNNQNMSFIQKAGILKQLGFKAYDRQIINYIRENYRTIEEQQEELEKLGFKIYNYNGKTYVR